MSEKEGSGVNFVHLRSRSSYSLLEGALPVKDLVGLCVDEGSPALGLTDVGNLHGALEFSEEAAVRGVQPLVGCAIGVRDKEGERGGREEGEGMLGLLAMTREGYGNLIWLSGRALEGKGEGGDGALMWDEVLGRSGGLACLTGGMTGPIDTAAAWGKEGEARRRLERLREAYGEKLCVELRREGMEGEAGRERFLLGEAKRLGLASVASCEPRYRSATEARSYEALLCVADRKRMDDGGRRRAPFGGWYQTCEEMWERFADIPRALENTKEVARWCVFRPGRMEPLLPRTHLEGEDAAKKLEEEAREGLGRRLGGVEKAGGGSKAEYEERLKYELNEIVRMGYEGYFLIVADIVNYARSRGIPVGPGRGSGAGSLAAWALGITGLDPLRFGLMFERFLNPERVSLPDFDIDFCQERRGEVLKYVKERYGEDRVGQIVTFGSLHARALIKDVGRALGLGYDKTDALSKGVDVRLEGAAIPKLSDVLADKGSTLHKEMELDEEVRDLVETAKPLDGLYRHVSVHAAGVVIADRPLTEIAPAWRDSSGTLTTQFSMDWASAAGLVKFDFLGLKTLSVLRAAREEAEGLGAKDADPEGFPLEDEGAFEMLGRGETTGVFQLEGEGVREVLRQVKPDKLEDIAAITAMYRPGPMERIPDFVKGKRGGARATYEHEAMGKILDETYGVAVYQEQVMGIAREVAGCSLAEADLLRRAMGKKDPREMASQRARFVEGARSRGLSEGEAERLFGRVERFAGYGFNKSHAMCYGLVAWWTALMKSRYPGPFVSASMTFDMGSPERTAMWLGEARRLGIETTAPDVNVSSDVFRSLGLKKEGVVFGLAAIRDVGRGAARAIVEEREREGKYGGVLDFLTRLRGAVNKRAFEGLAKAGAFDGLYGNRRALVEGSERLFQRAEELSRAQAVGQGSLWGGEGEAESGGGGEEDLGLEVKEDWDAARRSVEELSVCGFFVSARPWEEWGELALGCGFGGLSEAGKGGKTRAAAAVIKLSRRGRGRYARKVMLADGTGMREAWIFREELGEKEGLWGAGTLASVELEGRSQGGEMRLEVKSASRLEKGVEGARVWVEGGAEALEGLRGVLKRYGKRRGGCEAALLSDGERWSLGGVVGTPELLSELRGLSGVKRVWVEKMREEKLGLAMLRAASCRCKDWARGIGGLVCAGGVGVKGGVGVGAVWICAVWICAVWICAVWI